MLPMRPTHPCCPACWACEPRRAERTNMQLVTCLLCVATCSRCRRSGCWSCALGLGACRTCRRPVTMWLPSSQSKPLGAGCTVLLCTPCTSITGLATVDLEVDLLSPVDPLSPDTRVARKLLVESWMVLAHQFSPIIHSHCPGGPWTTGFLRAQPTTQTILRARCELAFKMQNILARCPHAPYSAPHPSLATHTP